MANPRHGCIGYGRNESIDFESEGSDADEM